MRTLPIKNARNIISMNEKRRQYPGGIIYVEGQEIKAIGSSSSFETADTVIDAKDKIVYPGLINTHHVNRNSSGGYDNCRGKGSRGKWAAHSY